MHSVMQYLNLSCCNNEQAILSDICRMETAGLITKQQAESVDTGRIFRFFQTDLGQKLISSKEILREFKFSILDDASKYYEDVRDDYILLQGVIDCALVENEGITVIDFKTDYITEDNLDEKIEHYQMQVSTYANALEKIYQKPVIAAYIYFFSCEKLICIH